MAPSTSTRAQQRAATERRILDVARRRFAEGGYDRTNLRAISKEAEVDPSLVVQYFGSKAELFAQVVAARWPVEAPPPGKRPRDLVGHVMDTFLSTVSDEGGAAVAALLRSSLTHPDAAATTRRVLFDQSAVRVLSPLVEGRERELRAALVAAMLLGVHVSRSLLRVKVLEAATAAQLRAHLEGPVLSVLLGRRRGRQATHSTRRP